MPGAFAALDKYIRTKSKDEGFAMNRTQALLRLIKVEEEFNSGRYVTRAQLSMEEAGKDA